MLLNHIGWSRGMKELICLDLLLVWVVFKRIYCVLGVYRNRFHLHRWTMSSEGSGKGDVYLFCNMTFAMMGVLAWQVAKSLIKFFFSWFLRGWSHGDLNFFSSPGSPPHLVCFFFSLCVCLCVWVLTSSLITARLLPITTLHLSRLEGHACDLCLTINGSHCNLR